VAETDATDARVGPAYRSWRRGVSSDRRSSPPGGVLLEGGADDVEGAWRWFLERSGHGDVVVLRATPDDGYEAWIRELPPVRSFQTLQLGGPEAAADPFVIASIERADGLFVAGGDQFDYIGTWTGTAIQRAVNEAIAAGVPAGGISAGLAVLGGFVFTAEHDTITSAQALADPFDDRVCLARGFLSVPGLESTITDSHFSERARLGRLLAFMARTIVDGWTTEVRGIGIDERTALRLLPDGVATVEGEGAAWLVRMTTDDVRSCAPGRPLEVGAVHAVDLRDAGTFDLRSWNGAGAAHHTVTASAGRVRMDAR
jgi:cyanophycinase